MKDSLRVARRLCRELGTLKRTHQNPLLVHICEKPGAEWVLYCKDGQQVHLEGDAARTWFAERGHPVEEIDGVPVGGTIHVQGGDGTDVERD